MVIVEVTSAEVDSLEFDGVGGTIGNEKPDDDVIFDNDGCRLGVGKVPADLVIVDVYEAVESDETTTETITDKVPVISEMRVAFGVVGDASTEGSLIAARG